MCVAAALGGKGDRRGLPVPIQGEAVMLHRPACQVQAAARQMARLGADRIRITAGWSVLAPDPTSRRMPDFNPGNPDAYPQHQWSRIDHAVKASTRAGLDVQLDIAFWAPRWAVERKRKARR